MLYGVTSLDHEYKIPVLSEPDMGVCPNLVDPELYRVPESVDVPSSFAEADEALIEQAESRGTVQGERVYRTQYVEARCGPRSVYATGWNRPGCVDQITWQTKHIRPTLSRSIVLVLIRC